MEEPRFWPTARLDYELEMAVWIGTGSALGRPLPIGKAADHIAGLSLLNDWSARDLQAWEYQPLGPFLAKNFHTTVSPWVVTSCALAPFRVAQPPRPDGDPAPLPYLYDVGDQGHGAFAISMDVAILTERMRAEGKAPERLSKGDMSVMYWTVAQLVTHHTASGCDLRPGDLLGTGTLSGASRDSWGSLIELTEGAKTAIELSNGEKRTFLEGGDEIVMTAHGEQDGCVSIGFGECRARDRARMTETARLVLHDYSRSSASYRVRIALNLKGLDYEQVSHDLRARNSAPGIISRSIRKGSCPRSTQGPELFRKVAPSSNIWRSVTRKCRFCPLTRMDAPLCGRWPRSSPAISTRSTICACRSICATGST